MCTALNWSLGQHLPPHFYEYISTYKRKFLWREEGYFTDIIHFRCGKMLPTLKLSPFTSSWKILMMEKMLCRQLKTHPKKRKKREMTSPYKTQKRPKDTPKKWKKGHILGRYIFKRKFYTFLLSHTFTFKRVLFSLSWKPLLHGHKKGSNGDKWIKGSIFFCILGPLHILSLYKWTLWDRTNIQEKGNRYG